MTFLLAAAVTPTSAEGEGEPRRVGEGVREAGLDLGGSAHTTILKAGAAGGLRRRAARGRRRGLLRFHHACMRPIDRACVCCS